MPLAEGLLILSKDFKLLVQISWCLLSLDSDIEDMMAMFIMGKYVKEIGSIAVSVQKQVEKKEVARPKHLLSSATKNP